MKGEYRLYGSDSEGLKSNLTSRDQSVLDGYLRYCATTAGPTKVKDYRRYMLQFRDVIEKPLDQVTCEDAVEFWALVNHSPHEPATKAMIRRTVKRFLKWRYRDIEMLEMLKSPGMPLVNTRKINKSVLFTNDEINRMLHAAERIRDKAILMLFAETGARPQEMRGMRWMDVGWQNEEVQLYSTKTCRGRTLPIIHAVSYLRHWHDSWAYADPQGSDYVFPALSRANCPRNQPISSSYLNRLIKKLAKKAGIDRRVNAYLLRHSRLTELYKLGVKGIEHNKFAGHSPGSKHQNVYVHLDNSDLKQSLFDNVYNRDEKPTVSDQSAQMMSTMSQMQAMYQKQIEMMQQQMLQMQQQLLQQTQTVPPTISVENS